MYINSGLENSDIHKLFSKVTGLEPNLALSILNFAYLHGGCIAGSCALAMYLEKNNMPSYRPYDIDIYIPCKTGDGRRIWSYAPGGVGRKSLNRIASPPFNPDRAIALDDPFGNNQSHWGFIDRMFQTELGNYYMKVGGIYKTPTVSYYADVDNLAGLPKEENSNSLWTQISTYRRREIGDLDGGRWYNEKRYNGDKYKNNGGVNYDKRANGDTIEGYAPNPMGHQEIQLIFLKEDVDVSQYIDKNYDFSICKVYTSLQALKQENKLVSLHEESIKNRILNIPNNWKYISFAACFKTVTRRFIKYTQRGFIPAHYKDISMTGWTNVEKEESLTPLADSYKKMTILLKFYLYQKIVKVYEQEGEEPFSREQANGIYELLQEDINDLIDDFKRFDMVEFWNKSYGKSILRQISLTFSDEDLILSKSILTSFLEEILDFLGKTMWFLYDKIAERLYDDELDDYISVDDSKDNMSYLSEELDVYNDDGSVKDKYSKAEFIAQIHEPIANRVYRARVQASIDKKDPSDINLDAEYLMREGHLSLSDYEYSDLSAEIRRRKKGSTGEVNYNIDPDNIHMKTLIGNIENLQKLGKHNKEAVVRNIKSHLKGGRRKKLMRFIMKDS
tara:strand:+ start:2213 stop:4066 length:1854 start_codon:yes stop_codon:yes gene_type:complete